MQIGKGRPLCCFFWLLSCMVAAYLFLELSSSFLTILAVSVSVLAGIFVLWAFLWRRRRYHFFYVAFLLLGVLVGALCALRYECRVVRPAETFAAARDGETVEVSGVIVSQSADSSYFNTYGFRMGLPDGDTTDVYLTVEGERSLAVGDVVSLPVVLVPISQCGESDHRIRSLRADGYLLAGECTSSENCEIFERDRLSWRDQLALVQFRLSYRLRKAVGGEAGDFMAALVLGRQDELSASTKLDFQRTGASHLLALSGTHLTVLIILLDALLKRLRCPYYARIVISVTMAVGYLLLTGCCISMLRATFMLLCLYLSRLRGEPHDALTALSVFFGLCVAMRPTWMLDAGLWLSVLAMLALIEVVPALFQRGYTGKKRCFRWLFRTVVLPVIEAVLVFLMLLIPMALFFGEISWMTPISNLILVPLTTILLAMGLGALPILYLSDVVPLVADFADVLTDIIRYFADICLDFTAALSRVRGALISLRYDFMPVLLIILAAIFLCFLLLKWKRPRRFWAVFGGWAILFCLCITIANTLRAGQWNATYTVHGKSELLTLDDTGRTVLCDMTDGSYTTYRELLNGALPDATTEIDALILTHYHSRHISTVDRLTGDIRVHAIWLPLTMPRATQEKAEQDEGIARSIAALAEKRGVRVYYYVPEEGADIASGLTVTGLYYSMIKRSSHPTLAVTWEYRSGDEAFSHRLLLLGASAWEGEYAHHLADLMARSDMIIASAHGPIIKSTYEVSALQHAPDMILFADQTTMDAMDVSPEILRGTRLGRIEKTHTKWRLP